MSSDLVIGLNAVIMAVSDGAPQVLVTQEGGARDSLPFGAFEPQTDRTFELALRRFVSEQTGFSLGYVEQLYTFGDRGREAPLAHLRGAEEARVISVGYLGLTPEAGALDERGGVWKSWYAYFPWEDHRAGPPDALVKRVTPALRDWADEAGSDGRRRARWERVCSAFGLDDWAWNDQRALDRYELMYEAGLSPEALTDRASTPADPEPQIDGAFAPGQPMASDHRRILATAISRLRAKIRYRPVLFELVGETFTLRDLQDTAEAITGLSLHAQNFRRALDRSGLVETTGRMETRTGGRPAQLYRVRAELNKGGVALGVATPRLKDPS